MGIDPQLWGPAGWRLIHSVCYGAPETLNATDKMHYATFLRALGNVLPCGTCRKHFGENLQKHPLTDEVLSTRNHLFAWSVTMHNEVNLMHNKKLWTPEEALAALTTVPEKKEPTLQKSNRGGTLLLLAAVLLLIIIAIIAITSGGRRT